MCVCVCVCVYFFNVGFTALLLFLLFTLFIKIKIRKSYLINSLFSDPQSSPFLSLTKDFTQKSYLIHSLAILLEYSLAIEYS